MICNKGCSIIPSSLSQLTLIKRIYNRNLKRDGLIITHQYLGCAEKVYGI